LTNPKIIEFSKANSAELLKKYSKLWEPPPNLSPSEWAEKNIYIPAGNKIPGLIRFNNAPYQREPLDMAINPKCNRITLMWGAQVGKTQLINCTQAYFIAQRPCSQMMMQPSGGDVKTWLETKFNPMIENNPSLNDLVAKPRGRDGVNNQQMKSYPGGWLMLAYSGSPKTMRGRSAPKIYCDEVDGYERTVEGDAVDLLWQRAATFGDERLLVETSTPTIKGLSKIENSFEQGDQRRYYIPCPKCYTMQTLKWSNVVWDKAENGQHLPETAKYECEKCSHKITDGEKIAGLRKGKWIAEKSFNGHASYHLSELYSAFRKWGDIVTSFLEKKRSKSLQTFINVSLAETWEEEGETIEPNFLYMRREHYDAEVPEGVLVLVCGIDVQDDRIEGEVIGYGLDNESWGIEEFVLHGNPANPILWGQLYDRLIKSYYNNQEEKFNITAACIDSGGHYTQQVYDFVKKNSAVHRWYAVKGSSSAGVPIAVKSKTKKSFFNIGTDTAKEVIYSRLNVGKIGAGYCHFPMTYDEEYIFQLTAEKRVTKYVNGHPKQIWVKTRPRNEKLDCRVYALAALTILNPAFNVIADRRDSRRIEAKKTKIEEKPVDEVMVRKERRRRVPSKTRGGFVNGWRG
jgi:phage terminase large subunit GpA-like protein